MKYRVEDKYICSQVDIDVLNARLKRIMSLDKNIKKDNYYNIRSIYFEDYDNSCFFENESGIDNRKKYRLRIYNLSSNLIKLEIKYKKNGYTRKESAILSDNIFRKIIYGETLEFSELNGNKVLNSLYLAQNLNLLKPIIIVEYERTAYVNMCGNVRITLDQNIRVSTHIERFFDSDIMPIPILEKNQHILEVKYDEFIPDYIRDVLDLGSLTKTSFSKYYLSRLKLGEIR